MPEKTLMDYYKVWIREFRANKGLPPLDQHNLDGYLSMLQKGEYFYKDHWIETMNRFAKDNGKKGVNYHRGSEIVIFDMSAIECIVDTEKTYEELSSRK